MSRTRLGRAGEGMHSTNQEWFLVALGWAALLPVIVSVLQQSWYVQIRLHPPPGWISKWLKGLGSTPSKCFATSIPLIDTLFGVQQWCFPLSWLCRLVSQPRWAEGQSDAQGGCWRLLRGWRLQQGYFPLRKGFCSPGEDAGSVFPYCWGPTARLPTRTWYLTWHLTHSWHPRANSQSMQSLRVMWGHLPRSMACNVILLCWASEDRSHAGS